MKLSVIIVSYNVKHFLEQCLCSVKNAIQNLDAEVLVIDNNSSDGSIEFLQPQFSWVKFMANKENMGFGKANNQALKMAIGEFVLFLNPDTLLPEDALEKCIHFFEENKKAGALGIQMLDGSGQFLPESKRAFPSPLTSLFKLMGLSRIFPKSKIFAKYHLGNLPQNSNAEVDVLAGAFMMVRKKILDEIGSFDERFFMYGEDVDLSYRIQKAGWQNWYFAEANIIHFKGESTKKGSLNYVRMFYQAMSLFVQKHYGGGKAVFFGFFIQLAIWIRAGFTALASLIKWVGLPLIDAAIVFASLHAIKFFWASQIKPGLMFQPIVGNVVLPVFTIIFIFSGAMAGLYDKGYKPRRAVQAMLLATVINLALYSLLGEGQRFSRGIIFFGSLLAVFAIVFFRWLLVKTGLLPNGDNGNLSEQMLIVGSQKSFDDLNNLLKENGTQEKVLGRIATAENEEKTLGNFNHLQEAIKNIPAKEMAFCLDENLSMKQVVTVLQKKLRWHYSFHYKGTQGLIGSHDKNSLGNVVSKNVGYRLANPFYQRSKNIFDKFSTIILLVTFPFHIIFIKNKTGFFKNIWPVFFGKKTWVGYNTVATNLPKIQDGILANTGQPFGKSNALPMLDIWYATHYDWVFDAKTLLKGFGYLGEG